MLYRICFSAMLLLLRHDFFYTPCGEEQAIEGSHVGGCQLYCLAVVVLRLQQEMQICRIVALSTSLNFSSPAQVARSHPKCIGSLLASGGRGGCVGCVATPEQLDSNLASTINCQKPPRNRKLPWHSLGPGCTSHTAPSKPPGRPTLFIHKFPQDY